MPCAPDRGVRLRVPSATGDGRVRSRAAITVAVASLGGLDADGVNARGKKDFKPLLTQASVSVTTSKTPARGREPVVWSDARRSVAFTMRSGAHSPDAAAHVRDAVMLIGPTVCPPQEGPVMER